MVSAALPASWTRTRFRRAAIAATFLSTLFVVTAMPVGAGWTWCSRDPVLTFTRDVLPEHELDVQLRLDTSVLPLNEDAAVLNVTTPRNVVGDDPFDLATNLLFNMNTVFDPRLGAADSPSYSVLLEGYVASSTAQDYRVDLVVTGAPLDRVPAGTIQATCQGQTNKAVRVKVQFQPFDVSCQKDTTWVSILSAP